MLPLHLGALHPIEQALTFVLAFGPFVVLGIVVVVMRRRQAHHDHEQDSGSDSGPGLDDDRIGGFDGVGHGLRHRQLRTAGPVPLDTLGERAVVGEQRRQLRMMRIGR